MDCNSPPATQMNIISSPLEHIKQATWKMISFCLFCSCIPNFAPQSRAADFNVIAFYTGKDDLAHISFVHEANQWFPKMAAKYHFTYQATDNWSNLNSGFLAQYQVVLFLDTRPDAP